MYGAFSFFNHIAITGKFQAVTSRQVAELQLKVDTDKRPAVTNSSSAVPPVKSRAAWRPPRLHSLTFGEYRITEAA